MNEKSQKKLLLLLILVFAFSYRLLLLTWDTYPPGADIGLHESIINSIMPHQTNFVTNYYHMGGGVSVTNPGFHIFVSFIILMTGIPDYLAQAVVVSFFSTFIVLCAFIITRYVWSESASFIVAFLTAVSAGDIAMLTWAGYPNVITLMLIPLIFYLYLQRSRFSRGFFLSATSLLVCAIFLTHSLSALMFILITVTTVFFASIFSKRIGVPRRQFIPWLLPIFLGGLLASPYLIELGPLYFGSQGTLTGEVSAITEALLSTRLVPVEFVFLSLIPVFVFFLLSKLYKGKFITLTTILFAVWILVPILSTQSYLFGIYLDYNRFLYFLSLPVIVFVGFLIDHESHIFSGVMDYVLKVLRKEFPPEKIGYPRIVLRLSSRVNPYMGRKNMYSAFVCLFVILSLIFLPIFMTPSVAIAGANFYQVMTDPGYTAVQWVKDQTPVGSVCVTDALYGWWLSGFAERPTLSAVDPQYLILAREFEPATIARNLLDTDYIIDNGLIQIREDGGYIGRHNPIFLAKLDNNYFPYPFFDFNDSEVLVTCRINNDVQILNLTQVPVENMHIETDANHASVFVERGNQIFNFTQETTVYQGVRFVNMLVTLNSAAEGVSLDSIDFVLHTKGNSIQVGNTVALIDPYMKVCGQLIFNEGQPAVVRTLTSENPSCLELMYNLHGKSEANMQLLVGVYQFKLTPDTNTLLENVKTCLNRVSDMPLDVFDYRSAIESWNISYIVLRDPESIPRFSNDPMFNLVFINKAAAIFVVKRNIS